MATTVVAGEAPVKKSYTLNATHRCDRCGAQAYVQTVLHTGHDLLWCSHHYNRFHSALSEFVDSTLDERDRLDVGSRLKGSENS